ncbi:MAG: ROK family transcriptional regulator [Acidimicrobiia bacterium]|nr:ROK family transcriptional regulator [Acidimicrobiia bacterium]
MPASRLPVDGAARRVGVTADEVRRHNLATVLHRLHRAGPLSRSRLASLTGLSRSTIADLVAELSSLGLVEEGPGLAPSGPGRPSPMVYARPEGAVVLAIELAVDSLSVATVGLGGHVFDRRRVARPREQASPAEAVRDVGDLGHPLLDALPPDHRLVGIGVGVVGIARRSDGLVHLAPNLGWRDVPIGKMVTAEFGAEQPVMVANEADLGALAELRRGARPGVHHLIYIAGEVGIGAGVIVDGEPLLGAAGYAGEAGHTLVNPTGWPCRCGATGCWETEAGEAALLRHAGLGDTATGLAALDALSERAAAGDSAVLDAMAEVGRWLGLGIGNLVNLFNPEVVVLGGLYHRFYLYLASAVLQGARSQALAAPWSRVVIMPSVLGADATLLGAAELALTPTIADPTGAGRAPAFRT